jgi:hypothetical protein
MDPLQIRENEVFETLKRLKGLSFTIIGGYAVNAYALPRFSVDCDIVIANKTDLTEIENRLLEYGYKRKKPVGSEDNVSFARYEKRLKDSFKVSFDILIGEVVDRQTNVSISAAWIFKNSKIRILKGKTIREELEVRIIDIDALFVMKMISCRSTDIRDLFMLAPNVKERDWVKQEIASKYNFDERFEKVMTKITSKEFRDGLQGVYGLMNEQVFEKSTKALLGLGNEK